MKKIAIILTNQSTYGEVLEPTGLWLAEATDFVKEITKSGFKVDYISPEGGYVPIDPRSLKSIYAPADVMKIYQNDDFRKQALSQSLSVNKVNAQDYAAIYFTGGHGVVWDFPDNKTLQDLTRDIYEAGGIVSSVCHGLAGLLNVRLSDGSFLINQRTVTGFTQTEEILSGKQKLVPFGTEKEAKKRGAYFIKKRPFSSFAIADNRLITGQNPMSGEAVAHLVIDALQ